MNQIIIFYNNIRQNILYIKRSDTNCYIYTELLCKIISCIIRVGKVIKICYLYFVYKYRIKLML